MSVHIDNSTLDTISTAARMKENAAAMDLVAKLNNNGTDLAQDSDAESDDSLLEECSRICMCEKCMEKILPKGRVRDCCGLQLHVLFFVLFLFCVCLFVCFFPEIYE